jgi:hypothetical protein
MFGGVWGSCSPWPTPIDRERAFWSRPEAERRHYVALYDYDGRFRAASAEAEASGRDAVAALVAPYARPSELVDPRASPRVPSPGSVALVGTCQRAGSTGRQRMELGTGVVVTCDSELCKVGPGPRSGHVERPRPGSGHSSRIAACSLRGPAGRGHSSSTIAQERRTPCTRPRNPDPCDHRPRGCIGELGLAR